jgi:hypothetical protein
MSTVGDITLVGYLFSEGPKDSPKESFGPSESPLDLWRVLWTFGESFGQCSFFASIPILSKKNLPGAIKLIRFVMSTVGDITLAGYLFSESPKDSPKESFGPLESPLYNVHFYFHIYFVQAGSLVRGPCFLGKSIFFCKAEIKTSSE